MDRLGKKGTTLASLLAVAVLFAGLGVFLDGEVLPPVTDTEKLIKETEVQSSLQSLREKTRAIPPEPSDISLQLGRAIEAANQNESERSSEIEERIAVSQTKIEETNRILDEKGRTDKGVSSSEKLDAFNQKVEELQSRLVELEESK